MIRKLLLRIRLVAFIFFCLIYFRGHSGLAQYIPWKSFNTAHGLGDIEVYTIYESIFDTTLWFGTRNGATKYDGMWKNINIDKKNSPGNKVRAIVEYDSTQIWFGTEKGVKIFSHEKIDSGPSILCDESIQVMKKDIDGNLWIGSLNGVFHLASSDLTWEHYYMDNNSSLNNEIYSIEFVDNMIWFGSGNGSIYRFDKNDKWDIFPTAIKSPIPDLFRDDNNILWAATDGNHLLYFYDNQFIPFGKDKLWRTVSAIEQDWNGSFWFATKDGGYLGGVWSLDSINVEESWNRYTIENGLASNDVFDVMEDSYRNLWFATRYGGVSRFDRSWQTFNFGKKSWTVGDEILAIEKDNDGNIWFGLSGNGVYKYDGFTMNLVSAHETINAIENSYDSILWFGTSDEGIKIVVESGLNPYPGPLDHKTIYSILEDSNQNLWFGTKNDGAFRLKRNPQIEWTPFSTNNGLPSNRVYAIFEDHDGVLWFATDRGISYYARDKMIPIDKDSVKIISNKVFTAIAEDNDGTLWFGTKDKGVIKYTRLIWDAVMTEDGLASNAVNTILFDSNNKQLWFGTDRGVNCLIRDKNKELWLFYNKQNSGLPSDWIKSMLLDYKTNHEEPNDTTTTIWFGMDSGGAVRYMGEAFPPETYILTKEDTIFNIDRPIFEVTARDNISSRFELSYSYLIWKMNESGTGKERIIDWTDFSFDYRIMIPPLDNGKYEIWVRAKDSDGNIDPSPDISPFEIDKFLLKTFDPFGREIETSESGKSVTIYIPPKAFDDTIGIKIAEIRNSKFFVAYEISAIHPEIQTLASPKIQKPGTITIKDPSIVLDTEDKKYLTILYASSDDDISWSPSGGTVNFMDSTIVASFKSFGIYAVGIVQRSDSNFIVKDFYCQPRAFSTTGNGPANHTTILLTVGTKIQAEIKIYNVAGRLIRNLSTKQPLFPGENAITWDGRNEENHNCSSGLYIICAIVGNKKMFETVAIVNN